MRWDRMAERRMQAARARGELEGLAGEGRPLPDRGGGDFADSAGFRIMAEAGALPEEIRLRKAIEAQRAVLAAATAPDERKAAMAALSDLMTRLTIQEEARRRFAHLDK